MNCELKSGDVLIAEKYYTNTAKVKLYQGTNDRGDTVYASEISVPCRFDYDTKENVTFSYDEILLGRSLSMQDDEYLVLLYDKSDEKQSEIYDQLYNDYKNKEEHLSIYYVDMSSGLNKKFSTTGESNKNPADVSDFLINGPTLIRVNNHIVQDYYEGEENIKSIIQ